MTIIRKGADGEQAITLAEWRDRTRNASRPLTDGATWTATEFDSQGSNEEPESNGDDYRTRQPSVRFDRLVA